MKEGTKNFVLGTAMVILCVVGFLGILVMANRTGDPQTERAVGAGLALVVLVGWGVAEYRRRKKNGLPVCGWDCFPEGTVCNPRDTDNVNVIRDILMVLVVVLTTGALIFGSVELSTSLDYTAWQSASGCDGCVGGTLPSCSNSTLDLCQDVKSGTLVQACDDGVAGASDPPTCEGVSLSARGNDYLDANGVRCTYFTTTSAGRVSTSTCTVIRQLTCSDCAEFAPQTSNRVLVAAVVVAIAGCLCLSPLILVLVGCVLGDKGPKVRGEDAA